MKTINATKARTNFFNLIKDTISKQKIFHIQHRQGGVVLLSEGEYENLQETLELLSLPGFRESLKRSIAQIARGETYSMDDIFEKKK